MAIDDLIASGIRPPQVDDPTTTYGKLMQIQSQRQQQQSNAIDLRLKQQDETDQKTIRQAYMESGGDPAKFKALVMQRGASPKAIQQIEQHQLTMRKSYADLDKVDLENEQNRHEKLRGELTSFLGQTPEYKAANWQPWIQSHVQNGHLTQQEAASLLQEHPTYPGDEQGKLYANGLTTGIELAKEASAAKDADARAQTAATGKARLDLETPGIQAQNTTRGMQAAGQSVATVGNQAQYDAWRAAQPDAVRNSIPAFYSPAAVQMVERAGMSADQRAQVDQGKATLDQTRVRDANTEKDRQVTQGQGQQRIGLERQGLDIQRQGIDLRRVEADPFGALGVNPHPMGGASGAQAKTGQEFLATLPPAMATRVQIIASGRETLTAAEKRTPSGRALQTAVEQFDPSWSEQRAQLRKAFTQGPDGRNIGNLNTAPVHLDQMHEAAAAMKNGSWQPGNELYNYIATKFGAAAPTNYQFVMQSFAGEAASALKGNATDPEIAHVIATLSGAQSPEQADGVALKGLHVIGAKLNTYNERYHAVNKDDPWTPVLPSARAVFAKYGMDPTAGPAGANGGNTNGGPKRPSLDSFWKK